MAESRAERDEDLNSLRRERDDARSQLVDIHEALRWWCAHPKYSIYTESKYWMVRKGSHREGHEQVSYDGTGPSIAAALVRLAKKARAAT